MNGMLDPEMIRLAQEQMSRIPPDELLRMQQQMFSNPDLLRAASESMRNMRPEDLRFAAEQMRNLPPEQIADMSARMANVTPEQVASMSGPRRDYEYQGALMLKNQGNQLHGSGQYSEAIEKYTRAKANLAGLTSPEAASLRTTCSLNLMSCFLKTAQYDKAIQEGTEVLATDPRNLKALYRRGQAYKEQGRLRLAVADLSEAAAVAPEDETVAEVLRRTKEELEKAEPEDVQDRDGPIIEEITEEEADRLTASEDAVSEAVDQRASVSSFPGMPAVDDQSYAEALNAVKQNPELVRNMHSVMSTVDPAQIAAMSGGKMSPEMAKLATDMMKNMSPSDFESMVEMAKNFERPSARSSAATASSSLDRRPEVPTSSNTFSGLGMQSTAMEQQLRKDPAMKEMMASMIKNMTPESMASMSQQLGIKLTPEEAAQAQRAVSNLSVDQIDRLMRWAERAQMAAQQARRAKDWLLGKPGLILAILMLLVAMLLHYFGFMGK